MIFIHGCSWLLFNQQFSRHHSASMPNYMNHEEALEDGRCILEC